MLSKDGKKELMKMASIGKDEEISVADTVVE